MEEMKDSGIEWVEKCPAHWKIMANKHIMKKVKNIKVIYENEDILSLTMKGVIVRDLEAGGKMPTSFDGYQILYPNNLLMCLFDYDVTPRCIGLIKKYGLSSPAYSQFEMKNQNYEGYYYYYYLMIDNTKALLHLAKNLRHSFTEEQLGLIHAPVPPIKEQIAIANLLDEKCSEIDRLFADIQSEIDSLEEYRMSIINEVLRCGISGKSKHKEVRFKYIATVKANLVPPTFFLEYPQVSPENIAKNTGKLLSYSTVEDSGIISGNHLFYKGQIIYSKIRPNLNKAIIAPFDGLCSADMYPIEAKINSKYLLYAMLSRHFVEQVTLIMQDRVKMPKINQDELGNIGVYIAPDIEQKEIVLYLDKKCAEIDSIIETKKEQLTVLGEYKKAIIYEYVTGKKEVI
jgi:type I restriction enzyme S subunit